MIDVRRGEKERDKKTKGGRDRRRTGRGDNEEGRAWNKEAFGKSLREIIVMDVRNGEKGRDEKEGGMKR